MTPTTGVEAVPEAPAFRHDGAGKPDRRDIEPELDDEREDVAEVAVLDVERSDQEGGAEARQHRQRDKGGQQPISASSTRSRTTPSAEEDPEVDREIDERDDSRGSRNDQGRKIHLADQVGVADEDVRSFAEDRRKQKLPQHASKHHDRIRSPSFAR